MDSRFHGNDPSSLKLRRGRQLGRGDIVIVESEIRSTSGLWPFASVFANASTRQARLRLHFDAAGNFWGVKICGVGVSFFWELC
jgi:hypothetical protein